MPQSSAKFTTKIKPLEHMKMMIVEVPKAIVEKLGGFVRQRFQCTINKSVTWQCGLVAYHNGSAYISLNKKILKEIGPTSKERISVSLVKDESKYGMDISVELSTLLKQDKEGNRRFHLLPPGKQRYIIYYVSQVKSSQLRIERAIRLIENLKRTIVGKESFREIVGTKIKD